MKSLVAFVPIHDYVKKKRSVPSNVTTKYHNIEVTIEKYLVGSHTTKRSLIIVRG